ncbi:MAG: glycoside hydrolase family 29 (alpha-L-fucosidase) [Bacteroidetes bacterium]|nr:MAG: glycoside hydrolase family 29 (alpha-L-fucosidase) [Bacteroidota bacterium]
MKFFFFLCFLVPLTGFSQSEKNHNPVPTKSQLAWHQMEFYLFAHFGPNTFTDKEWGEGTEPEDIFNPTHLDCRQWCRVAKAAGAKGIIVTAKHHDGFCLWPSKYSTHTVRESKWKNGKGDVLKELSQACKEYGLKFGVYISPWDRNHPKYGTPAYNEVFIKMMKEIFTRYGPIWELWWDGANGEGPNGKKQVYDWDRFKRTIKAISPNTVIFSDVGPHIRWVGNENGIAGETNWNLLDTTGFTPGAGAPPADTLNRGNVNGKNWIPAECDVSIRPGWFYHKEEDEKVKTPEQLFQLWLRSVGRGANLLLNVPPDRRGRINEKDSAALLGFKNLRDANFKDNFSLTAKKEFHYDGIIYKQNEFADGNPKTFQNPLDYSRADFWIKFDPVKRINCIVLKEVIDKGQQVKQATLYLLKGADAVKEIPLTTIGHKRIITFPAEDISAIRFVIKDAKGTAMISEIETYLVNENLIEK